jgi:hypothetical protein
LWAEQLGLAAGLYGLIPVVNAVTTPGSALWVTLPGGQTAVAGFDLTMLGAGVLLALTARKAARPGVTRPRPARRALAAGETAPSAAGETPVESTVIASEAKQSTGRMDCHGPSALAMTEKGDCHEDSSLAMTIHQGCPDDTAPSAADEAGNAGAASGKTGEAAA